MKEDRSVNRQFERMQPFGETGGRGYENVAYWIIHKKTVAFLVSFPMEKAKNTIAIFPKSGTISISMYTALGVCMQMLRKTDT